MTKGLIRYQHSGDLHFVTFSCYRRQPYPETWPARNLFEHSMETMRIRYQFLVSGYDDPTSLTAEFADYICPSGVCSE
jgi:putative transposase